MKTCTRCRETKTETEFGVSGKYRASVCRACDNERAKQWRADNRELSRRIVINSKMKRQYGITVDDRDCAIEIRDGLCDICQEPAAQTSSRSEDKVLHVDHDHKTGALRGMLCPRCNKLLGWMELYRLEAGAYLDNPPGLFPTASDGAPTDGGGLDT